VREIGLADQDRKLGQAQCHCWLMDDSSTLSSTTQVSHGTALPQNGLGGGSPYSEEDALDLLGLIHAIHGEEGINTDSA
jgi:hypothetical protein